jgi:hypothetical protein
MTNTNYSKLFKDLNKSMAKISTFTKNLTKEQDLFSTISSKLKKEYTAWSKVATATPGKTVKTRRKRSKNGTRRGRKAGRPKSTVSHTVAA